MNLCKETRIYIVSLKCIVNNTQNMVTYKFNVVFSCKYSIHICRQIYFILLYCALYGNKHVHEEIMLRFLKLYYTPSCVSTLLATLSNAKLSKFCFIRAGRKT